MTDIPYVRQLQQRQFLSVYLINIMIGSALKSRKILNSFKYYFSSYDVYNPLTEKIYQSYGPIENKKQMHQKLIKLHQVRLKWQSIDQQIKTNNIEKFIDKFIQQKQSLITTIHESTGKTIPQSEQQINFCIDLLRNDIKESYQTQFVKQKGKYTLEPFQNVLITYDQRTPAISSLKYLVSACIAGNSLILKPKRYAFPITKSIQKIWNQTNSEYPLIYVPTNKYIEGLEEMITHRQTGFLSYSGDIDSGNQLYHFMARKNDIFAESQFLLTSSDSAYVTKNLSEQRLRNAAKIVAKGAFSNSGNNFCSIKRIFLDQQIEAKFTQFFLEQAKKYNHQTMSPIISTYHINKAKEQLTIIQKLKDENLKLLTSVQKKDSKMNLFIDPIVFKVNGIPNLQYWNTPYIIPIVFIETVTSPQVCLQKINESIFGISSSIFSENFQQIQELGRGIEAGIINGNYWGLSPGIPIAPRKRSGKGFSFSKYSFTNVVRSKSVNDSDSII